MGHAKVVIIRSNPVDPDPRVEKIARALGTTAQAVSVLAWDRTGVLPRYATEGAVQIERLPIKADFGAGLRNIVKLLRWNLHVLVWLIRHRQAYSHIHACDFDTIFPSLVAKLLYNKKVVYDIFDTYFSGLNMPFPLRKMIQYLEYRAIERADATILVDEVRTSQIQGAKPKKLVFIYNSPETVETPPSIPAPDGIFRVAFIGILQRERGLLEMIDVVKRHPSWQLDIAGFGAAEPEVLRASEALTNVHFHGRISYEHAMAIYARSDVMFATYDPQVPNHRYSSANKLFEAMMLGKPIIVASHTSMDETVDTYHLGCTVHYGNIEQLEEALQSLSTWSAEDKGQFARRVQLVYQQHFSWDLMKKRLLELYNTLE